MLGSLARSEDVSTGREDVDEEEDMVFLRKCF